MTLLPVADRIAVKLEEVESVSKGGIALPETVQAKRDKPLKGRVVSRGKGRRDMNGQLIEFDVKIGDIVIFNPNACAEIEYNSGSYYIMSELNVLAIISRE